MALIECVDCKAMISDRAPACPRCGGPLPERSPEPSRAPDAGPPDATQSTFAGPAEAALHDDTPVGDYVPPNQKPGWVHALGLAGASVVAGTALAAWEYGTDGSPALLVASGIGMGLIPLVISLIVLAFRKRGGAWIAFALVAAALAWSSQEARTLRAADDAATKAEYAKLQDAGARMRAGKPVEATLPPVPAAGHYSEADMLRITRETYVATNNALTRKLTRITEAEGKYPPAEILSATTLADPQGLHRARAAIIEYRRNQDLREAALQKFGSDTEARLVPMMQDRPKMLADFNAKRTATRQRVADLAKAQRAAINAMDQVVRLAEAHSGDLEVHDGRLMFPNDESLAEFNRRQNVLMGAGAEVRYQMSRFEEERGRVHANLSKPLP